MKKDWQNDTSGMNSLWSKIGRFVINTHTPHQQFSQNILAFIETDRKY